MNYDIEIQVEDEFQTHIDLPSLQRAAEATLSACNIDCAAITIVVTNNEEVRTLNREFRNVDAVTDVLSFPNATDEDEDNEDDSTEKVGTENKAPTLILPPELLEEAEQYLGDIIIAYPYTAHQAEKYGVSIASEMRLMTVHGVLHLLGYDHATIEEEAEMWQLQTEILSTFGDQIDVSQRVYGE